MSNCISGFSGWMVISRSSLYAENFNLWWMLMSLLTALPWAINPPLQGTNNKSPFAAFVGEVIATIFFEGTSLTCHGIGVTKIQDQIYINAMFGRISPTYIRSWGQLWAEVTEVCPPKKDHSHIKVSTSKGLMKFDLSLLHEAIKKQPDLGQVCSLFFHSVSSVEPNPKRHQGEVWMRKQKKHFV